MYEKSPSAITRRRCLTVFASAAAFPIAGAAAPAARAVRPGLHTWQGMALGGDASILLDGFDAAESGSLIDRAVSELDRLEQVLSLYRPTSALSRLNRTGLLNDTPDELLGVLEHCRALHINSGGAFDPSVQRLWEHYQSADGRADMSTAFNDARASVGFNRVEIAGKRTSLAPGMALTLNGIAQGFITDRVANLFHEAGARHTLVNLGEFRATGPKADGSDWQIGLRNPESLWRLSGTVALTRGAVATSAASGHRMGTNHHLLDPATGESASHYSSVTVTAPSATLADGLSTALYAMALPEAKKLVKNYQGVAAHFTLANGQVELTDGWQVADL